MDSINTVNFEDLFDFSPEPAPGHSGGATGGVEDEAQEKLRTTSQPIQHSDSTRASRDSDAFADFEAVIAGEERSYNNQRSFHQLSASVPTHWNSSSIGGQARDLIRTSKDSLSSSGTDFTVGSVDQLLKSLPGPNQNVGDPPAASSSVPVVVKSKRGRKPGQKSLRTDMKTKLERSRQSARECRARKKLRYQYLDDLILEREKANEALREELIKYQKWCHELDKGRIPDGLQDMLTEFKNEQQANM